MSAVPRPARRTKLAHALGTIAICIAALSCTAARAGTSAHAMVVSGQAGHAGGGAFDCATSGPQPGVLARFGTSNSLPTEGYPIVGWPAPLSTTAARRALALRMWTSDLWETISTMAFISRRRTPPPILASSRRRAAAVTQATRAAALDMRTAKAQRCPQIRSRLLLMRVRSGAPKTARNNRRLSLEPFGRRSSWPAWSSLPRMAEEWA